MPAPEDVIFHIALRDDWEAAVAADAPYALSTRGLSLREVGFIHCSFRHQVGAIHRQLYGDASDQLVVLAIDPHRVGAEVRVENLDGGDELFPHVYGPVPVQSVVATYRINGDGRLVATTAEG